MAAPALLQAAGTTPEAPDNLQGSMTNGLVTLTWDVPADDEGVEGYNIYINNQYSNTVRTNRYSRQLAADTLYAFKVVAFDATPRNFSPASASLTLPEALVPTDLTIPPSVPTGLVGSVDNGRVSLSWEPSTDDEAVQGYNVYRDNQYFTTVHTPSYSTANAADEQHAWYVVAIDVRTNFSARSERIILPDPGPVDTTLPPSIPDGLSGSVQAGSSTDVVTLNWQASSDDQAVAGYNIYRDRRYIATRFTTQYQGNVDSGSSHAFSVVAFDFDGNFSASSESLTLPEGSGTTDPGVPPSVPTGLAGETTTANGQTQVQLTWNASTSTAKVSGYNIYRNNQYRTSVFTTAYSDTVPAGEAYAYAVVAFDEFGNFSAKSQALSLLGDTNQPPFFSDLSDQTLRVGERWELLLKPVDLDGGAAGVLVSTLPFGMQLVDNRNGSRSLVWTPVQADTGQYEVTISAFDLKDTDLRTSETIVITVLNDDTPAPDSTFAVSVPQAAYNLQEGNTTGVDIPVNLVRDTGESANITLSVEAVEPSDDKNITAQFSKSTLTPADTSTTLTLSLGIDVLPIQPHQRQFNIRASNGSSTETTRVTVAVTPTSRDDVYLLIGQSNMTGSSEDNAKQAAPGEADAPNLRIRQANVNLNDRKLYPNDDAYTDIDTNFDTPAIVTAEDPLHHPLDPDSQAKEGTRIGMGLSFAKTALAATTRNIILVPAAWSGSGFCRISGPPAHWNATATTHSDLGNTLLYERAIARVNEALRLSNGILRGILWHQGESDSRDECAPLYEANLINLVERLRSDISVDARGVEARGAEANIPFVLGTMSKGADERGDFSNFSSGKAIVDGVHRTISSIIPHSDVVNNDDLIPANGYPCGEGSCIHFGSAALREMGVRSYNALVNAAGN